MTAGLYDREGMPTDLAAHGMNLDIHPAMCRFHEQIAKALRGYKIGMEAYRDDVLDRGRKIDSEMQAAIDGMNAGLFTNTRAALSHLSKTYPALFPSNGKDTSDESSEDNGAKSDVFYDIKKRHGID